MSFQDFWSRYPKKVAKRDAEKAWEKLSMFDRAVALDALSEHVVAWERKDRQFIPHPATWIRARRFEDDIREDTRQADHEFFKIHGWNRRMVES
jgi:hypothetical protein